MPREKIEYEIKDESFVALQGWMLTELGLKGNELIIYALIYGFTQTYNIGYTGGIRYLALWTNSTRQSVHKVLKSLSKKELICQGTARIDDVNYVYIKALKGKQSLHQAENKCKQSLHECKQSLHEVSTKFTSEGKQSLHTHYNINNNISDNYNYNISEKKSKKKKQKSESEFVVPSLEEVKKYITESNLNVDAEFFYDYYQSRGWKLGKDIDMDDWKATVRNWNRKSTKEESEPKSDGSMDKYEFVFNIFNTYTDEHGEEHSAYWDEDKEQYYIWDSETNIREYVDSSRVKRA